MSRISRSGNEGSIEGGERVEAKCKENCSSASFPSANRKIVHVCSNGWSIGSVENEIRSLCHRDFDGPLERERERGADRRQSLARERLRLLEG